MAKYKHKITLKELLEDGEKIKKADRKEAAERIGKLAVQLIREDCANSKSSVTGKPFKHLKDKGYKKKKGTSRANLSLSGSLLSSLKGKGWNYGASIDITGSKNELKAENHLKRDNDGGGIARAAEKKTGVRQRKFFPTGAEHLRKGILSKLRKEIEDLIE